MHISYSLKSNCEKMNNFRLALILLFANLVLSLLYFRYASICSYYYLSYFDTVYGTLKLALFIPLQWIFGAIILVLFTPGVIAASFTNGDALVLFSMAFTTFMAVIFARGIVKTRSEIIRFFLAVLLSAFVNVIFLSMACGVLSV